MTNSRFLTLLLMLLPCLGGSLAAADFDPSNPPEPNEIYKSNVYTYASPADKGYASGAGRYLEGTQVTISASASEANWEFKYWLIDGEIDAAHTSRTFTYTVGRVNVTFTAVFEYVAPTEPDEPDEPDEPEVPEFNPDSPAEPEYVEPEPDEPDEPVEPPVVIPKYALNLVASPRNAGSFNLDSGKTYTEGTNVSLTANGSQNFDFIGWYDADGNLLSTSLSLTYTMTAEDTTLTARWVYNPVDPDDPFSDNTQNDIDNTLYGDVNADGSVDITDVQRLLNIIRHTFVPGAGDHSGDLDNDGQTNVSDVQHVLNLISGNN